MDYNMRIKNFLTIKITKHTCKCFKTNIDKLIANVRDKDYENYEKIHHNM